MGPPAVALMTPRGPNFFLNFGILGVVLIFRFLLSIQVIEVTKELIEAVVRGQEFILVAKMVLPELSGRVPERLEQFGDGWVFLAEAQVGAGQPDLAQPRAKGELTGDEADRPAVQLCWP